MNNLQAIFLDFDGVILESIDVKAWAFEKLFEGYPKHQQRIVDYHMAHGGVSRYVKFKYIYKEILKEPISEEKFQQLCDAYSELVFDRVLQCDFVAGAREFLDKYYRQTPLFVISGTPHEEMNRIVEKKGLKRYFKEVCGSPRSKDEWVRELLGRYGFSAPQTVFIGDAMSDYEAADNNGCVFVARIPEGEKDIFAGKVVFARVKDLAGIGPLLTKAEQCQL
jgi:phosphoglycolate phosphatase-like HAD superfamily hydrolase